MLNTIALIIDSPLYDPNSGLKIFLYYTDQFFTYAFAVDASAKIIAMGFIWNSRDYYSAYLMNGWNILDFIVLIASFVNIYAYPEILVLKSLKVLRALHIFHYLTIIEDMKLFITALISAIPNIICVLVITFLYLFSVGIFITYFLKGALYSCSISDPLILTREVKKIKKTNRIA